MRSVRKAHLIVCVAALAGISCAQSVARKELPFDLSQLVFVVDGQQICEDKGRLQDYPSKVMDQIIAGGSKSVPVLIGRITDTRVMKTEEPIICFWYGMTVGDLALCTLADLFADSSDSKETIPGANWAKMMDPQDKDRPASDQLHLFVKRHGRGVLQSKWQKLWAQYKDQIYWNAKQKCFRLKGQ